MQAAETTQRFGEDRSACFVIRLPVDGDGSVLEWKASKQHPNTISTFISSSADGSTVSWEAGCTVLYVGQKP